LDGLEELVRRLRTQNEEFARVNQDLNNLKARLTQENFELHRQVQELDSSNGLLSKAKAQLQIQLDDAKARLDEETRVCGLDWLGRLYSAEYNIKIVHYPKYILSEKIIYIRSITLH